MHDVERQVASYMDAIVERVDVEDVDVRVSVRPPAPTFASHLRWALAGATAVFVALGAVAVFEWLARRGPMPFGSASGSLTGALSDMPGWVLAVGGVAAGSIAGSGFVLAAVVIRRRTKDRWEKEMETLERLPRETTRPPESPGRRALIAAAIVVLVLAVGFGTWMVIDEFTGVDHDIEMLIDDYASAWDAGNGEQVVAMMSPGGLHVDHPTYPEGIGGQDLVGLIDTMHDIMGYRFQTTGDPTIIESSGRYLAVQPGWIGIESIPHPGFHYFAITRTDGELVILQHEWLSPGWSG